MLPPDNDNRSSEELITHIIERLSENEEPYKIGAWENFNKKKKNKAIFWLTSTAAILVLGFTLFFWLGKNFENRKLNYVAFKNIKTNEETKDWETFVSKNKKTQSTNNINLKPSNNYDATFGLSNPKSRYSSLKILPKIKKQKTINLVTVNQNSGLKLSNNYDSTFTVFSNKSQSLPTRILTQTIKQKTINLVSKTYNTGLNILEKIENGYTTISPVPDSSNETQTHLFTRKAIVINLPADSGYTKKAANPKQPKEIMSEFFATQTKNSEQPKSIKKSSKWLLGLSIAPSLGNTPKLNMGYGLNMEYVISPKFSVNSGIGYNQLSATKNFDNANVFSEAVAIRSPDVTLKNMESINANMGGIDIPLEIKYNINKSIYVNIGISAFAVLNQQQSNSFIEEKLVRQIIVTTVGEQQENTFLVYERSTQPFSENQDDIPNYLAFYNLSFGFRQKITKKTFIGFEPFVKLPVQEITAQKLRLMGSGLRLRINF